ncbi:hypothetical protein TKK_0004837 [Trichogramma kaykai]|uniref:ABC transporter domain-containing protein n=1 Tax=Trichogramma kaykai TaxID=54128 RepID=A0ABD2XL69_9HYME
MTESVLDVSSVYYSTSLPVIGDSGSFGSCCGCAGQAEATSVLKDVSTRVYGGEVLAILGSKGSGKRALLDVVAGRTAKGETRGRVSLNGSLLTPELFRRHGAYVSHRCHLLPSLTVRQTLLYATRLAGLSGQRDSRVRQTLADLALSQLANRPVAELTKPEYRRLMLGVQLAKEPLLLLLDEPTWDTDPLNTYLIVSMLWSYATRRGSIVLLTMETPRSDVLPFVARVTLLCMGGTVYSGPTRSMLDYFTYIGFPCPELENPLMYYLCLATVDRRTRDRFYDSNQQISVLVDKFKAEGGSFLKEAPASSLGGAAAALALAKADNGGTPTSSQLAPTPSSMTQHQHHHHHHHHHHNSPSSVAAGQTTATMSSHKSLQSRGGVKPGCCSTLLALYLRSLAATFAINRSGVCHFGARLFLLPFLVAALSVYYSHSEPEQSTAFLQTSGLVFNVLTLFYLAGIVVTVLLFPGFRARYYQEQREGLYGGTMFIASYSLLSLPLSFISTVMSVGILVPIVELADFSAWAKATAVLWASFVCTEQLCCGCMMLVKRPATAACAVLYFTLAMILLASGSLRSLRALPDWLRPLTLGCPDRYASLALNQLALDTEQFRGLRYNATVACLPAGPPELCRYPDGAAYLRERFVAEEDSVSRVLNVDLNLLICVALSTGLVLLNGVLYMLPLSASFKAKFRE